MFIQSIWLQGPLVWHQGAWQYLRNAVAIDQCMRGVLEQALVVDNGRPKSFIVSRKPHWRCIKQSRLVQ
eukprot:5844747-Amphidinium_carterae.1